MGSVWCILRGIAYMYGQCLVHTFIADKVVSYFKKRSVRVGVVLLQARGFERPAWRIEKGFFLVWGSLLQAPAHGFGTVRACARIQTKRIWEAGYDVKFSQAPISPVLHWQVSPWICLSVLKGAFSVVMSVCFFSNSDITLPSYWFITSGVFILSRFSWCFCSNLFSTSR